ncbi:MAG: S8 family serine peptidase [Acidobacteria bacterium]|nr:S8 family serine peptidase [Acidobacteriota bacterium]MDA1233314.1 S8 family serine peptidase [Acidobacteriota bacterium]
MFNPPRLVAFLAVLVLIASSALAADRAAVYTVILDGPSVGQQLAETKQANGSDPAVRELGQSLQERQLQIMPVFAETGATVLGSVHNVLNAIFIRATPEQAKQIGSIVGVSNVLRSRPIRLHLDAASQILNLPAAQALTGGQDGSGAGIKIGVIDTGIDISHPAFNDPNVAPPAGYPRGFPEDQQFTNNKIIAARSYVHLLNPQDPQLSAPDDETPRDRVGHGTAVAMIAAGRPVSSPVGMLVGAAPKAFLGNYKIFGSPDIREFSSEAALVAAIDDAVSDGMDIITISSGVTAQYPWNETCGTQLCDPAAQAAQAAIDGFGVVVIAAAGNAGNSGQQAYPTLNSISSPASAPGVIAVGATSSSRRFLQSISYNGTTLDALAGSEPGLAGPLTAPAADAISAGDQFACSEFEAGAFSGQIAVIDDGQCPIEFKTDFAARAGAVGVVLINGDGRNFAERIPGLETLDIPTYTIGHDDGNGLISLLAVGSVSVTLDPTLNPETTLSDDIAVFSSRGPNLDGAVKPEVVAPGTSIFSAAQTLDRNGRAYSADGYTSLSGTSFAAPFVAGTAALVLQRRSTLTVAQVRSAIINTADPLLFDGIDPASVLAKGAGLLAAKAALDTQALVQPATLGFGALNGLTLPRQQALTLRNLASQARSFTAEVVPSVAAATAAIELDGLQELNFQLGGGAQRVITVRLTGSIPAAGIYEGVVRITVSGGAPLLEVPYSFTVGDGVPYNAMVIAGDDLIGTAGEPIPELLIVKVVDRYGQPVANEQVNFYVLDGGGAFAFDSQGQILKDNVTDPFGVAAADVDFGPEPGFQDFGVDVGAISIDFLNDSRAKPVIAGIVNGASFAASAPVAPGSIVSIFGDNLAEFLGGASSLPLPIALKHVSVSFDFPETGLSVAAPLYFGSPKQLNVQVPWEFAGHNFAIVKVRINDTVSGTFVLNLRDSAPAIFEFNFEGQLLGVATHANGAVVTPANPAKRGETIVVYGTGFGPLQTPQATGQPASGEVRLAATPVSTIGSVAFGGLAPGFVGLNQININVSPSSQSGAQELRLSTGGLTSKTVTLWVE